jgi:hypothetical protein
LRGNTTEGGRNREDGPQRVRMGEPKVGGVKASALKTVTIIPTVAAPTYNDDTYRSEVND